MISPAPVCASRKGHPRVAGWSAGRPTIIDSRLAATRVRITEIARFVRAAEASIVMHSINLIAFGDAQEFGGLCTAKVLSLANLSELSDGSM